MFRIHPLYLLLSALLFVIEVLIASYLHDPIIRPYGGDFLVVILLYCFIKSFLNTPVWPTALSVLAFACLVELTQYFRLADRLGFKPGSLGRIVLGSYFTWTDILSYTLGIASVIILEKTFNHERPVCK